MDIGNLPDKEFKIMVTKVLTEVRRTIHKQVRISTEIEYVRKCPTDLVQVKAILMRSNGWSDKIESRLDGLAK